MKGDTIMEIKPIRTEEDYDNALQKIYSLLDADPGSPEGEILEVLVTLVEAYETEHYSIPLPDPIEAIEYHVERLGLTRKDLEKYIGGAPRVSEILNRKRPLNLRMIRNLHRGLDISLEVLLQEYDVENSEPGDNADFSSLLLGVTLFEFLSTNSGEKTFPKSAKHIKNIFATASLKGSDIEPSSSTTFSHRSNLIANAYGATERNIQ